MSCWNLGASTSWNPQGLTRPVMGLLYLNIQWWSTQTVLMVWHFVPSPSTGPSHPTRLLCEYSVPWKLKIALRYYGKINERGPRQQIRSLIWLCTSRKGFSFLFEKHAALFSLIWYLFDSNQPTRCNSFTSLLLDVHVWLNVSGAFPPIIRSIQLH